MTTLPLHAIIFLGVLLTLGFAVMIGSIIVVIVACRQDKKFMDDVAAGKYNQSDGLPPAGIYDM